MALMACYKIKLLSSSQPKWLQVRRLRLLLLLLVL